VYFAATLAGLSAMIIAQVSPNTPQSLIVLMLVIVGGWILGYNLSGRLMFPQLFHNDNLQRNCDLGYIYTMTQRRIHGRFDIAYQSFLQNGFFADDTQVFSNPRQVELAARFATEHMYWRKRPKPEHFEKLRLIFKVFVVSGMHCHVLPCAKTREG
jgi:hypothetical protein